MRKNKNFFRYVNVTYNPTMINNCQELNIKKAKYVALDSNQHMFVGQS